jgi:hypothetical protein
MRDYRMAIFGELFNVSVVIQAGVHRIAILLLSANAHHVLFQLV